MNIRRLQNDGSYRNVTDVDFGADPVPLQRATRYDEDLDCLVYTRDRSTDMLGIVLIVISFLMIAVIFYFAGRFRWM